VSRQPDHARYPGQLQDATNLMFRVDDGGFTKRFGSVNIAKFETAPSGGPTARLPFHVIDFSAVEKYGLTIDNGTPHIVNLLTGAACTCTVSGGAGTYCTDSNADNLRFTTILGYTFVLNRSKIAAVTSDLSPAPPFGVVFVVADGRAGTYTITVDGHTATRVNSATNAADWDTTAMAGQLRSDIATALGANYSIGGGGSVIIVQRVNNAAMTVSATDPAGGQGILVTCNNIPISTTDKLPAYGLDGMVVTVAAAADVGQGAAYLKFTASTADPLQGYWAETIAPGINYKLDPTTMPQVLIRTAVNTFTLGPATWDDQTVGDRTTVPFPDFIGKEIHDITVFRDRLDLLSGEYHWFSATSEYFRFWPKLTTQALDNDPFGLRGSSGKIAVQNFAVPYRKILWATADAVQFELTSTDIFTQKKGVMDATTAYVAATQARPVPMQQMLYFASFIGGIGGSTATVLLEYSYDFNSLTSIATDVSKHVRGYIPAGIVDMTADAPTGNLFLLSSAQLDSLYTWTVYWDNIQSPIGKRDQSSWGTWKFPGAQLHGAKVSGGVLYIMATRSDGVWVEAIPLIEGNPFFPLYAPRLDRQVQLTGTYNAGTNQTTYTLPYPPATAGLVAVNQAGNSLPIVSSSNAGNTVVIAGNPGLLLFGFTYTSSAVLSKQYHRDQNGTSILNGTLRLVQATIAYKDTGYFELKVDQVGRDQDVFKFTGRQLGIAGGQPGSTPISDGVIVQGGLEADGSGAVITISNDTHLPSTITAVVFKGAFNELVRQG
jgi:hypothetical protein